MTELEKLQQNIKKAQNKLAEFQKSCDHPLDSVTTISGSSTGNWDPSDNCWWTDFTCHKCGKTWTKHKK